MVDLYAAISGGKYNVGICLRSSKLVVYMMIKPTNFNLQNLTQPDVIRECLVDKVSSRCDALFQLEKHHVDVKRRVLTDRTR